MTEQGFCYSPKTEKDNNVEMAKMITLKCIKTGTKNELICWMNNSTDPLVL
jgi:hypothetical protein